MLRKLKGLINDEKVLDLACVSIVLIGFVGLMGYLYYLLANIK